MTNTRCQPACNPDERDGAHCGDCGWSYPNLHAHVSTYSRDCDGGHGHDYVMTFTPDEVQESQKAYNDFSDIHFMQRVMNSVACPFAVEYGMTVKVDASGIEVSEQTDEGSRSAEVRWCRADCDETDESVSDEYAEMMGY